MHIKGLKDTNIVRCIDFSQQNNLHTSQHQYIHYKKKTPSKIRPHSPEAPPPPPPPPPRVCKQHYTCGNPAKWKVIGQPASTDHHQYWPRFHWQSRCAWGAKTSSASEQLKHPIWSLGNSRDTTDLWEHLTTTKAANDTQQTCGNISWL